jgi:hypothetical protein
MNSKDQNIYKTYQTDHPTIKEITIGERFITRNGDIIEFIGLTNGNDFTYHGDRYPFEFRIFTDSSDYLEHYSKHLKYYYNEEIDDIDILYRTVSIKDKLTIL